MEQKTWSKIELHAIPAGLRELRKQQGSSVRRAVDLEPDVLKDPKKSSTQP